MTCADCGRRAPVLHHTISDELLCDPCALAVWRTTPWILDGRTAVLVEAEAVAA